MQFMVNTSFDPHFCALFDNNDRLIAESHWMIPREDGQHIWDFLGQHLNPTDRLTFIGGITGPGSFSSLRTAGAVLNALSFKFDLPIHQARADQIIQDFLKSENRDSDSYLLNSFGQRVFWPQAGQLNVIDLTTESLPKGESFIIDWLPEAKRQDLKAAKNLDPLGPQKTMLTTLKAQNPQPSFLPDYEYPPVQS